MHEAVTISTAAKNFFPTSQEDLLSPIALTTRARTADTLTWSQAHEPSDVNSETILENWVPASNETASIHLPSIRRAPSAPLQKLSLPSNMPSRTPQSDVLPSKPEPSVGVNANNNRWRFNGNGQLVDSEAASAGWDLADEIVRLKIGDVGDVAEDVHSQMRTPPKSRMAVSAVVQLSETSPLETSSDASVESSPHPSDLPIGISHSRGSSTDTTISSSQESALSATSHTLLAPAPLKVITVGEVKERPHSFSGGLSSADLRRLQQVGEPVNTNGAAGDSSDKQLQHQQWSSLHYRETIGQNDKQFPAEQLIYPSLTNNSVSVPRPQPQIQPQLYEYRTQSIPQRDEIQTEYNNQARNFNTFQQAPAGSGFESRAVNTVNGITYRQIPRGFTPQGLMPSPTTLGYPGGHHSSHLSLGNTQQLYDMMLPGAHDNHHQAVSRVQQQHNVFRGNHHHSASDPSTMRDAATLAMLNGNMQAFGGPGPGFLASAMAPPSGISMYPNQFYGAQEAYPRPDVANAQAMAARIQAQYTGPYGTTQSMDGGMTSPVSVGSQNGPSANNRKLGLYKTELCRSWEEKGTCRYGSKCQFAHGEDELRKVSRHPKYKTEICRTFWVSGSCPYGKRCCFIHTELPAAGVPGAPGATSIADNAPPPPHTDGRARSLSINSDPNDASVSILARISAKRSQEGSGPNNASTPVDLTPQSNGFHYNSRPPTGSLRVDTSALDHSVVKQNKSAYPSFASNGILLPASEQTPVNAPAPAPVTAGPDLGRHNNSRLEIVGYNQRMNKTNSTNANIRHSFNGTEVVELNFNPSPPPVSGHPSFSMSSNESNSSSGHSARPNGHVRSGSAGNWGSFSRNSHFAPSPYPGSSSPAGEVKMNSPWSTSELAVGSSRLH